MPRFQVSDARFVFVDLLVVCNTPARQETRFITGILYLPWKNWRNGFQTMAFLRKPEETLGPRRIVLTDLHTSSPPTAKPIFDPKPPSDVNHGTLFRLLIA